MPIDEKDVEATFEFDSAEIDDLRRRWAALMDIVVWGELKSPKVGAVPRLRKRLLELGEAMRSLFSDRRWVPKPRERVKAAMASSLKTRDALLGLERAAKLVEGGEDFQRFERDLLDLRQALLVVMERHEAMWGELLESQYDDDGDDTGREGDDAGG